MRRPLVVVGLLLVHGCGRDPSFVIGPDGNLKKSYPSVEVSKHAAEVLADVKS